MPWHFWLTRCAKKWVQNNLQFCPRIHFVGEENFHSNRILIWLFNCWNFREFCWDFWSTNRIVCFWMVCTITKQEIIWIAVQAIKLFDSLWWICCYLLLSSPSRPEPILMNKPLVNESSKNSWLGNDVCLQWETKWMEEEEEKNN